MTDEFTLEYIFPQSNLILDWFKTAGCNSAQETYLLY